MKLSRLLLFLSLIGHVLFGSWWFVLRPKQAASIDQRATSARISASKETSSPLAEPLTSSSWTSWQSGSDFYYAAHLRSEGFPPRLIRALVAERVQARFKQRLAEIEQGHTLPYWRHSPYESDGNLTAEARKARRALLREMNQEIKEAVGAADFEDLDPWERSEQARVYGTLPADKADQLKAIRSDYDELGKQIDDQSGGVMLAEDREQHRLLEQERRADLVSILSPEELFEYDLRNSWNVRSLRSTLADFDATESEFRALAKAQLTVDQTDVMPMTSEEYARYLVTQKELLDTFSATLSPERAQALQLVTDPSYRPLTYLLDLYGYEKTMARPLVALQRDITHRAETIRKNSLFTPAQRDAELSALHREATAKIGTTLSRKAFEEYQKRDIGRWFRELSPGTAEPAKP